MENQGKGLRVDHYIFIVDNRSETRVLKMSEQKQMKWRKMPVPLKDIAKHPYYTLLEIGNNKATPVQWPFQQQEPLNEQEYETKNNKDIFIGEQTQKLQQQDITRMKQQLRPQELIGELVENNQQFSKKTEYSKEKYLKKKQMKYMFRLHVEPTSLINLHQHYFGNNGGEGVCGVRWDMFGLMLLNGGPYKETLVGEQGRGLLVAAVMQRGAQTTVISNRKGGIRNFLIVEQLNFDKEQKQAVKCLDWEQLGKSQAKFDNFLLMGNYDFSGIIESVQNNLKSGALIAFVCLSLKPIEECARLMKTKGYLNIRVEDSWCRQYQVLKNRTHPLMNMQSCSGYLLSAIKHAD